MNVYAKEFNESARRYTADLRHRELIQKALAGYYAKRDEFKNRFQSWPGARDLAAEIKWEAINHLDRYLDEFVSKLEARGTKVFWAPGAQEARDYIVGVARQHQVRAIIKSKSMTAEEIHLNDALEKAGFEVVESDLGEYIVQLREEPPYHLVFPAMHLTRQQISDLFHDKLGSEPTNNPEDLTMAARRVLRRKYCKADMGISGANFAIAETGMISITENEGNARLTTSLPKIHVALVGIEKVLPRLSDLALFLPMLATAGAGQSITCYNTLYGGPRQPGEPDGPEEFHVVLLDNRRTEILADAEQRDALHCIRCGACLNVCPIFKNIGGHSYGTTYQGPIGSVITPHLRGLQDWKHLSQASSLCGACTETCPVKINLHHHLLHNRRNAVRAQPARLEKLIQSAFVLMMRRPKLYQFAARMGRLAQPLQPLVRGTILDPLRAWTKTRSFPPLAQKSFRELWRERKAS
ncbi:MAG TPA: LutB/LldF family L-lactate oxidation iron-sulfur protein [Verrucomicrobiae bacterium]|nr:LutB/LldF family L-lactate oxidation iron-sulfur protein [Verrucomicrobiae bacterium]